MNYIHLYETTHAVMKTLSSEIIIDATIEKVWKILTDFPVYPDWNPFIINISGELKQDSFLNVTLKIEDRKESTFKPKLILVIPGEKFCWRGSLIVKGVFDGTHYFVLEKTEDNKTHLCHGENFRGLFAGPILKKIGNPTLSAFNLMNQALKEKAES